METFIGSLHGVGQDVKGLVPAGQDQVGPPVVGGQRRALHLPPQVGGLLRVVDGRKEGLVAAAQGLAADDVVHSQGPGGQKEGQD